MQRNAVDRLNFGRTGKHRYAAHDEGIAHPVVFIQRNGNHHARLKAPPERPTPTRPF